MFRLGWHEPKSVSFFQTSMHFDNALATLDPLNSVVAGKVWTENILLVKGASCLKNNLPQSNIFDNRFSDWIITSSFKQRINRLFGKWLFASTRCTPLKHAFRSRLDSAWLKVHYWVIFTILQFRSLTSQIVWYNQWNLKTVFFFWRFCSF